jgi:peroxiredoxin
VTDLSFRFLTVIAIAGALLTGCSEYSGWVQSRVGPGEAKVKPEGDRKLAPDFALKDATGKTVKLSDYRGKVVVLNFWATWCGPCTVEIPWFKEFQQTYKDRDFAVIGISEDDDGWQSVKPYIEHSKINYRIAIGTEEISQQYGGIDSLPTTFVIDREGRIAAVHVGLINKSEYQNEILRLLKTNVT